MPAEQVPHCPACSQRSWGLAQAGQRGREDTLNLLGRHFESRPLLIFQLGSWQRCIQFLHLSNSVPTSLLLVSSERIGQFQPYLIAVWELQKTNSVLILGGQWDRGPQGIPSPRVQLPCVPNSCLLGGAQLYLPLSQPAVEGHGTSKCRGREAGKRWGKGVQGGLGIPQYGFREQRGSKTCYGEKKVQGGDMSSPTIGDKICQKMHPFMWLCDCTVSTRFLCPDPTTKCSSGSRVIL